MRNALIVLLLLCLATLGRANNVTVSNATTVIDEGVTFLQFDLSWENSWRSDPTDLGADNPLNYDAAWVFAKYKDSFGVWRHIEMSGSHSAHSGFILNDASDQLGYFIYRSAPGAGNVALTNIKIGIDPIPGSYEVRIYAIEMVFVPLGAFTLGDGNGTTTSVGSLMLPGKQPVPISLAFKSDVRSNGGPLDDEVLSTSGIGIEGDGGLDTDNDGTVDNIFFPTGYEPFYCMKNEISQRSVADFLNTLTYTQQQNLNAQPDGSTSVAISDLYVWQAGEDPSVPAQYGVDRNGNGVPDEPDDNEWGAADIDWVFMAAWLDWAALRPMTELEFEKVCRGTKAAVTGEYVWGSTNIIAASDGLTTTNDFQTDEAIVGLMPDGNANFGDLFGRPLRTGIFADGSGTRVRSGAAFYGAMDMGGNMAETLVTVGNAAGRSFRALMGNGMVSTAGYANVNYWPGANNNNDPDVANGTAGSAGITGYAGIGVRGGDSADNAPRLQTSDRQNAANMSFHSGGRGVRHVGF